MNGVEALVASPEFFPLELDPRRRAVRLIRLSEDDYARASFLDERLLNEGYQDIWVSSSLMVQAASRLTPAADFIFHIGHVGSTLLARLLGHSESIFVLREPAPLRRLTMRPERIDDWLRTLLRLYGRTWRVGQRSLIKATSFVSDLAPVILSMDASSRALLVLVKPTVYITAILSGSASQGELKSLNEGRLARLARHLCVSSVLPVQTPGEMAAAAWACETCALVACAEAFPDRVKWLDFDAFLLNPRAGLSLCLAHFAGITEADLISTIMSSPDMYRYSKAPEYPFGAGVRGQILREAGKTHSIDVSRGMAWMEAMSKAHPRLAAAIVRSDAAAEA